MMWVPVVCQIYSLLYPFAAQIYTGSYSNMISLTFGTIHVKYIVIKAHMLA
jgi:hypothetical protein